MNTAKETMKVTKPSDREIRVERIFEWDGMPGHVSIDTLELEPLPQNRTRVIDVSVFHTSEERDEMLGAGMEGGLAQCRRARGLSEPRTGQSSDAPLDCPRRDRC